jgi:hypothetical protein
MVRTPSVEELGAILVGHGIVDFVSGGKLSKVERNALWSIVKKTTVATARALPRAAGTAARVGGTIAMRHPYIAAGAIIYVAATNREQIADLIREGYDVVQELPGAERREDFARDPAGFIHDVRESMPPGYGPGGLIRPITGVLMPKRKSKRRSAYNSGVSKGIKALKKSTSYGARGVLRTPRKAFGFVAKTVSKLLKGKKVSSKGASGVVKRSMKITVRKP